MGGIPAGIIVTEGDTVSKESLRIAQGGQQETRMMAVHLDLQGAIDQSPSKGVLDLSHQRSATTGANTVLAPLQGAPRPEHEKRCLVISTSLPCFWCYNSDPYVDFGKMQHEVLFLLFKNWIEEPIAYCLGLEWC